MTDILIYLVIAAAAGFAGLRIGTALGARRTHDAESRSTGKSTPQSRRLHELETDRARMEAILSGMVEGVLVVDGEGGLRFVNDSASRMINIESNLLGR